MLNTTDPTAVTTEVRLTAAGRRLLALIPQHGEAVDRHNSMPCNDPLFEEAERQANAIFKKAHAAVDAILTAPEANLGDLAVACAHVFLPGACSDQHERLHARLMEALLGTIGIAPSQCDFTAFWGSGDGEDEASGAEAAR